MIARFRCSSKTEAVCGPPFSLLNQLLQPRMISLAEFRSGLDSYLTGPNARPFVCDGSPLLCRSFIVGLNAATQLQKPFSTFWSNDTGFNRSAFEQDYDQARSRKGNRRVIEAISSRLGACLETNLYSVPTKKARQLTAKDRDRPIIEYLFRAIKPKLVVAHSNEPVRFFKENAACEEFTRNVQRACWQGHEFLIFGRPGPLYTMSTEDAQALGERLRQHLT